jgi:hypothetical protein
MEMEKKECRMCGKVRNISNMILISDELRSMIEYHCRITLDLTNSKYPKCICFNCNHSLTEFADFTLVASETQIKFSAKFQQVKVEIEELPLIVEYKNGKTSVLLGSEPKEEIQDECDSSQSTIINDRYFEDEQDDEDRDATFGKDLKGKEESDYDNMSSDSDSDYVGNKYYKRKKKPPARQRRVRLKRSKTNHGDDEIAVLKEVAEEDRNKNGTMKKKALSLYEGITWKDMRMSCVECDQVTEGPFELRTHHFKYHSLESQFKCFECPENNSLILSYFYQYLNHAVEHRESLKFCCVSLIYFFLRYCV